MIELPNEDLYEVIIRSLNRVNDLLVGHGERVAYSVMRLLEQDGRFSEEEISKIVWTVLFHDIGNFRKTDTWNLVQLENDQDYSHAIYGFLFLKTFFPFSQYATIVRYHHSTDAEIENACIEQKLKWVVKCLRIVDASDLYFVNNGRKDIDKAYTYFQNLSRRLFPAGLPIGSTDFSVMCDMDTIHYRLLERIKRQVLSSGEKEALLRTLVCSMDFRSHYTALHCSMMVRASDMLADCFELEPKVKNEIHIGAILHDLGKIAIPIEILESPGKLDGRLWEIMKSHVMITEDILKGCVSDEILQIAIRHHETLDGSGYPRGISGEELTLPQRIVAVGDIVSALSEERSYKQAFPLHEVMNILGQMCHAGKICPRVMKMLEDHSDSIYHAVLEEGLRTAEAFEQIYAKYYEFTQSSMQ
ncbi:HD domain-containing phosphohydrolase [Candidatus Agathobaculum pullicola]|uniref:HD-GYP domain-containing protein n=1 Tax=Candidatus Agathobaculum pullicola TaxID=2838426 RepID=UPI003F9130C9